MKIVSSHDESGPLKFAKMPVLCRLLFLCFPSEILETHHRARVKGKVKTVETHKWINHS